MTLLSDAIVSEHADGFDAFANHAFFAAVEDGSLSDESVRHYFINERGFVEQAVAVFAHLLAKAPTLSARRHLHTILNGLLYSQLDLFDTIYARLGISPEEGAEALRSNQIRAVYDGFTAIARDEDYASGLAAMFVAESTYARVSMRLTAKPLRNPLLRDWFGLHTETGFLQGVDWLKGEIDEQGRTGATADDLAPAVSTAIALELFFHDAPLQTPALD